MDWLMVGWLVLACLQLVLTGVVAWQYTRSNRGVPLARLAGAYVGLILNAGVVIAVAYLVVHFLPRWHPVGTWLAALACIIWLVWLGNQAAELFVIKLARDFTAQHERNTSPH